ncbi:MAG TPA: hypothetical protein PLV68_10250, partial [Ilumatobacteraceae bacterium]|nr:hypothetical protein [Ilumatobacteraceae bacterium]
DTVDGRTPIIAEVRHVPEVIGLVLVWMLATPKRLAAPDVPSQRKGSRLPQLSVIEGASDPRRRSS